MGKVKVFLAQMRGSSWMGGKVSSFHALPLQINLVSFRICQTVYIYTQVEGLAITPLFI